MKAAEVLGPTWEGPYGVRKAMHSGTYKLETMDGLVFIHPWNAEHLRQYYQ